MKHLPVQRLHDADWAAIEDQLKAVFYQVVFKPVMEVLKKGTAQITERVLENAGSGELARALRSGRIQYAEGVFSGSFSVGISRELRALGATWHPVLKVYRLGVDQTPEWVRAEAAVYQMRAKGIHEELTRTLIDLRERLDRIVDDHPLDATPALQRIEKGFKVTAELMEVQPRIGVEAKARLAKDYNQNLGLYIKKFSKESVDTLREEVEKNALAGYRFDRLAEIVRHRYGVTANKARFLARQETSLFMAKYRKERLGEAGVHRYQWSTAHDERVRTSHKPLDGRIFDYAHPPITDRTTGDRNNPGEDFNCRCVDIPVLESAALGV